MKKLAYILSLPILSLLGCMQSEPIRPQAESRGQYKVSVATAGKSVPDFTEKLVHRIVLTPGEVRGLLAQQKQGKLPFLSRLGKDSQGKVTGLKVYAFKSRNPKQTFGLQENDVVTAVNKTIARSNKDFYALIEALEKTNQASITLERKGQPHKILLFREANAPVG